jgi:hypothetical protein
MKAFIALLYFVVAVVIGRFGIAIAAFGEADDAPPAVLLGWALVIGAVVLGGLGVAHAVRAVRRQ